MPVWNNDHIELYSNVSEGEWYVRMYDVGDPANQILTWSHNLGDNITGFYGGYQGSAWTHCFVSGPMSQHTTVGSRSSSTAYTLNVLGNFYSSGSSIDYKEDIEDLVIDSSKIYDLQPRSFTYKIEHQNKAHWHLSGKEIGLISEEVSEIIPELVILEAGVHKNVDYNKISVLLVKELQELNKRLIIMENS